MNVTVYHNPRCSKSRQALALLHERGIEPNIVRYLETPPDTGTLSVILDRLGLEPRQLMRRNEQVYRDLDLANQSLSRDELIATMVENPVLIERPIVVAGEQVVLGRPPENVLSLL